MEDQNLIAEKIYLLIIVLYFVFLHLYRHRIKSSRFVTKYSWRLSKFKKGVKDQYPVGIDREFTKKVIVTSIKVIILLALCYGIYDRLSPGKKFTRLIDRTSVLAKEKKFDQAIIDMRNALKIRPDYVRGHYFLAHIYRNKGRLQEAVSELFKVIRINPGYQDSVGILSTLLKQGGDSKGLAELAAAIADTMPLYSKILTAQSLLMQREIAPAQKILQEALKSNPDSYQVYLVTGDLHVLAQEPQKAIRAYREALRLNFGLWEVHYSLAKLYLEEGRVDDGVRELEITRSLNEDFPLAALTLARLYYRKGEQERATKTLEDILKRYETNDEASYILAIVYTETKRYQDAINLFSRLPDNYHKKKGYLYNLAFAYYNTGKYDKALESLVSLRESKQLDVPGERLMARVQFSLGMFFESLDTIENLVKRGQADLRDKKLLRLAQKEISAGRTAMVQRKLRELQVVTSRHADLEHYLAKKDYGSLIEGAGKAVKENRLKAPFYNLLGVAYLGLGKIGHAKKNFMLSYTEKKDNPVPLINLVNVLVREGEDERAEELLLSHNRMFANEPVTRLILGRIYVKRGKFDDAEKLLQEVIRLNPRSFEAHQKLAVVHRIKGEMKAALTEYQNALKLNPDDALSLNDLAYIYAADNESLDKALEYANKAVRLLPNNVKVTDTLGWVHYQRGEFDQAYLSFKTAYELNPYLPIIPYHLGLTLFKMKRYKESEENLKLALSMKRELKEARKAKELLRTVAGALTSEKLR